MDLLTQKDIDLGEIFGGKPIKKFATHERALEVIKDVVQSILNAQLGKDPKFYILPDE